MKNFKVKNYTYEVHDYTGEYDPEGFASAEDVAAPDFEYLETEAAFVLFGVFPRDLEKVVKLSQDEFNFEGGVVYLFRGKDMNEYYGLRGTTAYYDDLIIAAIRYNSGNYGKIDMHCRLSKGRLGLFDQVVESNARAMEEE